MTKRTAVETAALLKEILNQKFGGKPSGRYQISRGHLLKLSGHKLFSQNYLEQLVIEGFDLGIVIVNLETSFAVIELSIIEGYRNVPPTIIDKAIKTKNGPYSI